MYNVYKSRSKLIVKEKKKLIVNTEKHVSFLGKEVTLNTLINPLVTLGKEKDIFILETKSQHQV